MGIGYFLQFGFAQHALEAAFLVAVSCGLIGPFVISRSMAFAVHGTSELAFTGAVGGLLVADNPLVGALVGALIVAGLIGIMGRRPSERDSSIGVILAAGLGLGVFLLGYYHGYASEALNILFGNIFGVSTGQIILLAGIALAVGVIMGVLWRPLLFASVDPDVAQARGVRTGLIGLVFLFVLAVTVTEAAQLVGTLLVLSLAITPAAAAQRLSASPTAVALLSVLFAVVSAEGGLLLSFQFPSVKPSVLIVGLSFFFYVAARLVGPPLVARRRQKTLASAGMSPAGPDVPRPRDYPEGPDLAELHHD
jgi:zinc/manganese transport system permease protein